MDFVDLIKQLSDAQVEFVVVGGFAATVYGCTLVTEDLDICIRFTDDNLGRLSQALEGLNPVHRMTPNRKPLSPDDLKSGLNNLYLDTEIGVLDCLGNIIGIGDYDKVEEKSIRVEYEGVMFKLVRLQSLIRSKELLGRERDKQAIAQLKFILEAGNGNIETLDRPGQ